MKKLSLLIAILGIAVSSQAQNGIVKLGLSNAFVKTINLEYEYLLNDQSSVMGEFGYQLPIAVPQTIFNRIEDLGTNNNLKFGSGEYGGAYVAAEYRYYVSGNAPQGFYVAPYVKFGNRNFTLDGSYSNNTLNIDSVSAGAELGIFTASFGAQAGYQFIIQDKFTLNLSIIGLGIGFNRVKGTFTADDNGVFDSFAEDTQEFINELPGLKNIDLVPDNLIKEISASGAFPFFAPRASISIGYMF